MTPRYRDGLAALVALIVLLAAGSRTVGIGPLTGPDVVGSGIVGALLLEAAFLRYPDVLLSVWERRYVPALGLLAVLGTGAVALRYAPWMLGLLVWGLVTYLALLGCVLVGVGNPLSWIVANSDRDR